MKFLVYLLLSLALVLPAQAGLLSHRRRLQTTVDEADHNTQAVAPPKGESKKGKGKGKGKKGKGGEICNFDPSSTPPLPDTSASYGFQAGYCFDSATCEVERCKQCGVLDTQREEYYCIPPQSAESIFSVPGFSPNKQLSKCTECCEGKVSSIVLAVNATGEYTVVSSATDGWIVECKKLESLLMTGVNEKTSILKTAIRDAGQYLCLAPVTNITSYPSIGKFGDINIDACGSGPSEGLKEAFGSMDVTVNGPQEIGQFKLHVSCSASVAVGSCLPAFSEPKANQRPPPEGETCGLYPMIVDGSSTGYWSTASAAYCSNESPTPCFNGRFADCGCNNCGGTPSPTPSPTRVNVFTPPPTAAPTPCNTPSPTFPTECDKCRQVAQEMCYFTDTSAACVVPKDIPDQPSSRNCCIGKTAGDTECPQAFTQGLVNNKISCEKYHGGGRCEWNCSNTSMRRMEVREKLTQLTESERNVLLVAHSSKLAALSGYISVAGLRG